jgi:cytoskeletal protein CcmA (bactofilin family)
MFESHLSRPTAQLQSADTNVTGGREDLMPNDNSPRATIDERRMRAWIGEALTVQGKVISTQDLNIDGTVEGTIELGSHGLTIGATASIKADLVADAITISGAVVGNVTAAKIVDLRATGSVEGDIVAPKLIMADGAVVKGRVDAAGKGK